MEKLNKVAIDAEQLSALLDLLVSHGVEEFEGFGLHVRFTPACFDEEVDDEVDSAGNKYPVSDILDTPIPLSPSKPEKSEKQEVKSIWHDPSLWPDGTPPKFK